MGNFNIYFLIINVLVEANIKEFLDTVKDKTDS